ncbi:hypothetical protein [Methylosinus sp. RM1]|uniref:PIN-like domain-containing protein n=1 Tax=Methylosinus sp. RM1 TaxID=2583817 RepID=UPI001408F8BE
MKVLFDNCTAPVMASTLDGFVSSFGHRAFHIKDAPGLPNGRHASDFEWIDYLRKSPDAWMFVSGDGRILKNAAERAALRSAGLHGFVLAPAYQKTPLHQVAATIVWKWPEIEAVTKLIAPPSMHEIPIGKNVRLRSLPL